VTSSCIFCDIVRGAAPASIVYSDEQVMAFVDIRPVNPGHLLVIPRTHAACVAELQPELGGQMFQVAMRLAQALRQTSLPCEGVNLFLADGAVAGQEVFHVHLHVLPRFRGDGFGFRFGPDYGALPARGALDGIAAAIRQQLEAVSGT